MTSDSETIAGGGRGESVECNDEVNLILRAQGGDPYALNDWFERLRPMLIHQAKARCGGCCYAEDLVQQACVRIWQHLSELREAKAFKCWCSRILSNEFRRCRRSVHCERNLKKVGTGGMESDSNPIEGVNVETNHLPQRGLYEVMELLRREVEGENGERRRVGVFMADHCVAQGELPPVRTIAAATFISHGSVERCRKEILQTWRRTLVAVDLILLTIVHLDFISSSL